MMLRRHMRTRRKRGAQHKRHLVGAAFATLLSENGVKHELEKAAETLGLKGAAVDASAFRSATRTLSRELEGTHKDAVQLLNSLSVPYGLLLAALFVCLPLVFAVLAPWLLSTLFPALSDFTGAGASLVAGLSGVLAMGAATLRSVTRHVEKARATFRTFAAKFEAAIEREAESEAANRARAEEEVLRIKREVDRCREEFEAASRAAAEASVAFNAEDPRQRLVHFLRDRVRSGVYSKELGFIATIRKDFEKLSQLMTASTRGHPNAALEEEARKELEKEINKLLASSSDLLSNDEIKNLRALSEIPAKPTTTFERIILYVDDLDRCPPDQVVAVLQAIHLLLTFPLFVVVVAVDMRWVLRALDSHYGDLLNPGEDGATSMDYLEKIFQIPYRVRDFRSGQTGNLVSDQLQPFVQLDDAPGPAETRPHAEIGGAGQTETVRQGSSASVGAGPKVAMPQIRPLSLSPDEVQFLDRLDARHSWSPRRRLRFANSYLLVRASMEQHTQTDLQQLAVMLACSEEKNMVSAVTELCEVTSVSVPSSTEFDQLQDYVKRFTFESK